MKKRSERLSVALSAVGVTMFALGVSWAAEACYAAMALGLLLVVVSVGWQTLFAVLRYGVAGVEEAQKAQRDEDEE